MKKILVILVLAVMLMAITLTVLFSGYIGDIWEKPKYKVLKIEQKETFGGKYNGLILEYQIKDKSGLHTMTCIQFTVNQTTYSRYMWDNRFIPALDWIKNNIPQDSRFLCWWDYGGMIMGYANRDVIAYAPSENLLKTVALWDEEKEPLLSNELLKDVSNALVTDNPSDTKQIMNKYGAKYVFVAMEDVDPLWKLGAILTGSGRNVTEYNTERYLKILLVRMWQEDKIEGFEKLYADDRVKIYKVL